MGKLIQVGSNYPKKKMDNVLREWKKSGYKLIWKKRFVKDYKFVKYKVPIKITGGARKGKTFMGEKHKKVPYKRVYYDVFVKLEGVE